MEVQTGELDDATRYLESRRSETIEDREPEFRRLLTYIRKYKKIEPGVKILEIGTGTGSVPILCKLNGLDCKGLEISQQFVDYGRNWGRKLGVEADIELGNIETTDIGIARYDVIIASSVFEHIEYWKVALDKAYRALKPGGALFFESTNKFSFVSGEYSFPLYGWLPNPARYKLRSSVQGPEIMKFGIDFNQFTYTGLRRAFRKVGFTGIYDVFDLVQEKPRGFAKQSIIGMSRSFRPFREVVLAFYPATTFVCTKAAVSEKPASSGLS
jgi:SAM-dependent methyltransferase